MGASLGRFALKRCQKPPRLDDFFVYLAPNSDQGMLSTSELIALLEDLESDRVERTTSVNNTDKFCQAICAFSNDFPGHNNPGYLIKSIASETEERILSERRTAQTYTFDVLPCEESALKNINLELFKLSYLPQAIDDEILEENHRESELQLSSLRFYSLKKKCSTNAGILLFGDDPFIDRKSFCGKTVTQKQSLFWINPHIC